MALASKKYEDLFDKTGSGKKRMTDEKQTKISESFASGVINEEPTTPDALEALIYQSKFIQEDLDEIRRYLGAEVSTNVSTNLSVTADGTSLTIASSDGTDASIPAASTTAWGAMTDANVESLNTASISPPAEGTYHNGSSEHIVWIPGTRFYSDTSGGIVYAEGVAKAGTTKSSLYYDFAGIDKKKVTHAYAYTSATVGKGLRIKRWAGILGVSASILANNVSTNVSQDITDWNCVPGEQLNIRIFLGSTSTELYGVQLTLAKA